MTDFNLENHGSIMLLTPETDNAQDWVTDNLPAPQHLQYWGRSIVVEPRYIEDIIVGIQSDGLLVG